MNFTYFLCSWEEMFPFRIKTLIYFELSSLSVAFLWFFILVPLIIFVFIFKKCITLFIFSYIPVHDYELSCTFIVAVKSELGVKAVKVLTLR